jgi:hypothetical protein
VESYSVEKLAGTGGLGAAGGSNTNSPRPGSGSGASSNRASGGRYRGVFVIADEDGEPLSQSDMDRVVAALQRLLQQHAIAAAAAASSGGGGQSSGLRKSDSVCSNMSAMTADLGTPSATGGGPGAAARTAAPAHLPPAAHWLTADSAPPSACHVLDRPWG